MRPALLSILVLAACAPEIEVERSAIIGGTASEVAGVGAILATGTTNAGPFGALVCTGALIAPDVVLTAAHCLEGASLELYFTRALDVSTFSQTLELPEDAVKAKLKKKHPGFVFSPAERPIGLGRYDDVGLIFLERPVDAELVVIVDAEGGALVAQGREVFVAGYGAKEVDGSQSGVLLSATSFINEVGDYEMQVGDAPPTPQKCHGDSGGPSFITVDDARVPALRVAGITSREYDETECEKGGVDTRVDRYYDWIVQEMLAGCQASERVACTIGVGPASPVPAPMPDAGVAEDAGSNLTPDDDEGGCTTVRPQRDLWPLLFVVMIAIRRRFRAHRA